MPFCISHIVACCNWPSAAFTGAEIGRERLVVLVLGEEAVDLGEKGGDRAAAVLGQLAADEIERLDAVGALVDHGDAGVAHELLHAPFGDIAVAAEHLLRLDGVGEARCR